MEKNKLRTLTEMVVIGGSAGSLDVILQLFPILRPGLSFATVIILHRQQSQPGILERLFASRTSLPVREVEDKDPINAGTIYIAPADYHLLIEKDKSFSLDISEKINFSRPSIDITFQTAAECYGSRLVGILLSGANSDGVEGLRAIHKNRGLIVVQDPASASVAFMPQQAVNDLNIDHILPDKEIAHFINSLSAD